MGNVLDYAPKKRLFLGWRAWWLAAGMLLVGLFICPSPYEMQRRQVCEECGILRRETQFMDLDIFASERLEETPVSLVVNSMARMRSHTHRFVGISATGRYLLFGGYWCESGSGDRVYSSTMDPRAAHLLGRLEEGGETTLSDAWRVYLLDLSTARQAQQAIILLDVPFDGFASLGEYRTWEAAHDLRGPVGLPPR